MLAFRANGGAEGRRARNQHKPWVRSVLGAMLLMIYLGVASVYALGGLEEDDSLTVHDRGLGGFKTNSADCADTSKSLAAVYICVVLYCFIGLVVVADDYYEPTLGLIHEELGLSQGVTGCTFMAISSSLPELVTGIIDVLGSNNTTTAFGMVIGSLMFNTCMIVVVIFSSSKRGYRIEKWPIGRDSFFYTWAFFAMMGVVLNDGGLFLHRSEPDRIYFRNNESVPTLKSSEVTGVVAFTTPTEGIMLLMFYLVYVLVIIFNQQIHTWFNENISFAWCATYSGKPSSTRPEYGLSNLQAAMEKHEEKEGKAGMRNTQDQEADQESQNGEDDFVPISNEYPDDPFQTAWPNNVGGIVFTILAFPYILALYYTMPTHLERGHCKNASLFTLTIGWLVGLTFAMTYYGSFTGCVLGIDPFLMGVLFLAVGTGIPNILGSFVVSRDGHVEMALSNMLGSNIFTIFVALGIPWIIGFPNELKWGDEIVSGTIIEGNGIAGLLLWILGSFILFLACLHLSSWRITRWVAVVMGVYYLFFLLFVTLSNACVFKVCLMERECSCGHRGLI